jgi:DNA-binding Lrp family transcriptional regulator
MSYKKEIRIFNLNALELDGQEIKLFLFYLWHRDNKNRVNKDYANAKKAADALGVTTRTVFRLLEKLHERKWIERVEGEVYINPNMGMSLMIDATNLGIQPKTETRSDKEYINNPEIRAAFKEMFPGKKVDKILDNLYRTTEKPVRNWHEFAKACISKSDLTKPKVIKSKGYGQDNGMEWD